MKFLNAFAIVTIFGLGTVASAQSPPPQTDAPSLSTRWVSSIVGMKVTTPSGATLGKVKDVIVDGYGQPTYAIISYGGVMGLGSKYVAVPWTTVAEMLERDKLLVDQGRLESAPLLAGSRPESANTSWRRAADSYWRAKVALSPAPTAETSSKQRNE